MSTHPTYYAAKKVAPVVEEHFKRQLAEARRMGEDDLAPEPNAESIAAIINATFWASFRPEEGRFPKISLPTCRRNTPDNRWSSSIRFH